MQYLLLLLFAFHTMLQNMDEDLSRDTEMSNLENNTGMLNLNVSCFLFKLEA